MTREMRKSCLVMTGRWAQCSDLTGLSASAQLWWRSSCHTVSSDDCREKGGDREADVLLFPLLELAAGYEEGQHQKRYRISCLQWMKPSKDGFTSPPDSTDQPMAISPADQNDTHQMPHSPYVSPEYSYSGEPVSLSTKPDPAGRRGPVPRWSSTINLHTAWRTEASPNIPQPSGGRGSKGLLLFLSWWMGIAPGRRTLGVGDQNLSPATISSMMMTKMGEPSEGKSPTNILGGWHFLNF